MIYFALGAIFGALCSLGARLAEPRCNRIVEAHRATGRLTTGSKKKPVIVEGFDPTQEFIDEHFETIKE